MTPRLPALKPIKVLRVLKRAGFFVHHTTGSHYILKHPDNPALRVTLPYHNKELKRGAEPPRVLRRLDCLRERVSTSRPLTYSVIDLYLKRAL